MKISLPNAVEPKGAKVADSRGRPSGKGALMLVLLAIGMIAGILLGLLFKVLVLVPAMLLTTAVITVLGFAKGLGFGMIALIVFGAVVSLQVGYIVGSFFATAATPIRYGRRPPATERATDRFAVSDRPQSLPRNTGHLGCTE